MLQVLLLLKLGLLWLCLGEGRDRRPGQVWLRRLSDVHGGGGVGTAAPSSHRLSVFVVTAAGSTGSRRRLPETGAARGPRGRAAVTSGVASLRRVAVEVAVEVAVGRGGVGVTEGRVGSQRGRLAGEPQGRASQATLAPPTDSFLHGEGLDPVPVVG